MFRFLVTLSIFPFLLTSLFAQSEQDKQALRDLKAVYEECIKIDDLSALEPHLAEDFSAIMITGEEVTNIEDLKSFWVKAKEYMGEDSSYSVTVNADDSLFIDNIALAKGTSSDTIETRGQTIEFNTSWTAVCQRMPDGSWKLARLQVTTHPVENPFARMVNKAKLWSSAIITGIIALLAGFLVGKRIGYKKTSNQAG